MADRFQLPSRLAGDEQTRRNFDAIESWINHSGGFDNKVEAVAGPLADQRILDATPGIIAQVDVSGGIPTPTEYINVNDPATNPNYTVPTVTNLKVTPLPRSLFVYWAVPTDYEFRTYQVQYATPSNGGNPGSTGRPLEGQFWGWDNNAGLGPAVRGSSCSIASGPMSVTMDYWVRVRVVATNGKTSAWSYYGPVTMSKIGYTEIGNVQANQVIATLGQMDSAVIGQLDLTKASVAGGSVLIDSTGVQLSGADFKLVDETNTGLVTALRDRQNLLFDHSAELAQVNQDATALEAGRVFPLFSDPGNASLGKWRPSVWTSGAFSANGGIFCNPSDVSAGREAAFDERALRLSSRETATWSQIAPIDRAALTSKYTFSAYFARHAGSSGTINATVVIQPLTAAYANNGSSFTATFPVAGANFLYKRYAATTGNLPGSTAYLRVSLYTDASHCVCDGMQLVSGDKPVPYEPESTSMRFLSGNNPSGPLLTNLAGTRMVSDSMELRSGGGSTGALSCPSMGAGWREFSATVGGATGGAWIHPSAVSGMPDGFSNTDSGVDYLDLKGKWCLKYGGTYIPSNATININAACNVTVTGNAAWSWCVRLYGTMTDGGTYGVIHTWSDIKIPSGQGSIISCSHITSCDYDVLKVYLFFYGETGTTAYSIRTGADGGGIGERYTWMNATVLL